MISSQEFEIALKIIDSYRIQLEKGLVQANYVKPRVVNLQEGVSKTTFLALRYYYKEYYNISLIWNDLLTMDENLLAAIDFQKMSYTRGFGKTNLFNFKKLLVINSVIKTEHLEIPMKFSVV